MRITTWNVNSVRARLPRILPWLEKNRPDVVLLQETKVEDELFPREPLEDAGYNIAVCGQKTYNGVAVLCKHRIEDLVRCLPDDGEGADKRLLGCIVGDTMLLNLYVPNGQSVGSAKFAYKLEWLARVRRMLDERYDPAEKIVLAGDFNVTFDDRDVWDPVLLRETIHCSTPEREALRGLCGFGLVDGLREFTQEPGIHTWWDHRAGSFPKGQGLRIDHFLLSEKARAACRGIEVDVEERRGKGVSDHAPVTATFE
jgi:exodeoxyribonuclease-3